MGYNVNYFIISIVLGFFLWSFTFSNFYILENNKSNEMLSSYIQNVVNKKNIEVLPSKQRDTDFPIRAKPDPKLIHTDLSYWVNEVLPYEEDKNLSAYIIYPKYGTIVPVRQLNKEDKQKILNKKWFNHYKYLQEWSLHYVWYSPSQWLGNMVIAWHSAYQNKDKGRYKTAFQSVIFSNQDDIIWYFEKTSDWTYTRFEYKITDSNKISSKDTKILFPTKQIKQLTTYTCYPIGSTENRRYNKADLISIQPNFILKNKNNQNVNN